eukprot:2312839-Rhodomonas_salina.1
MEALAAGMTTGSRSPARFHSQPDLTCTGNLARLHGETSSDSTAWQPLSGCMSLALPPLPSLCTPLPPSAQPSFLSTSFRSVNQLSQRVRARNEHR